MLLFTVCLYILKINLSYLIIISIIVTNKASRRESVNMLDRYINITIYLIIISFDEFDIMNTWSSFASLKVDFQRLINTFLIDNTLWYIIASLQHVLVIIKDKLYNKVFETRFCVVYNCSEEHCIPRKHLPLTFLKF